jgi:hypothetical protein
MEEASIVAFRRAGGIVVYGYYFSENLRMASGDAAKFLVDVIANFAACVADGRIEIYNEFSLQHELGHLLRIQLPNRKVQFERNVSFFFSRNLPFVKKEIDVSAYSPDKKLLSYAIELKFPRNGQYPEQMFSFCKDLCFIEQLKEAGFQHAALIIFADDELFYRGGGVGIYEYFRSGRPISGCIRKPTGSADMQVTIRGNYHVTWRPVTGSLRYAIIDAVRTPPRSSAMVNLP